MTSYKAALTAALMLGAAMPAFAQTPPAPTPPAAGAQPAAPARDYGLSRQESAAFQPVIVALNAQDWATATTALAAAAAAARGNGAKYLVGQIRLQIGLGSQNRAAQSQGIDEMLASGGALPTEMRALLENQLDFANAAGDTAKAQRVMAQLDALSPNDPSRFIRQAAVRVRANDAAGAIGLYQQAIQLQTTNGQPVPADWRLRIASAAYGARLPETPRYMREWLAAAPSQVGWHDSLTVYADLNNANNPLKLDIYRLMRAAGAMTAEGDFIGLAQSANEVRGFGEVKEVLEEGLRRNLIVRNIEYARERLGVATARAADDRGSLAEGRTAALAARTPVAALAMGDAYYGYHQYPQAVELYRAALQKGADADLANIRIGAALAMAGNRAEAETAFRAVGAGPRAELAQYWLLWLSTRPAA